MPELPEVETIRRALVPVMTGRRLERVTITDPQVVRPGDPAAISAALTGDTVASLERRGKYLVVRLESSRSLLVHLRMTGSFRSARDGEPLRDPHLRAVVSLDNGSDVGYVDVRRFGTWDLLDDADASRFLGGRLGPEPLGPRFTARWLEQRIASRRAPIKSVLLDQRVAAGVGNIYADESLWAARVHPGRTAGSVTPAEVRRLHRALRNSLRLGIERQGATLRDYRAPDGAAGGMQEEFRAYGRAGRSCRRCGAALAKTWVGGRGTTFCPRCQPA